MTHEPGRGSVIPTTDEPERSFLENDRDSQYSIVDLAGRCASFSGGQHHGELPATRRDGPARACCRCSRARSDRLLAGTADAVDRVVAGPRRRIAGRREPPGSRSRAATARPARAARVPLDRLHGQPGSLGVDSVARKHLGYSPIPSRYAECVSTFLSGFLTPYLNDHRPCLLSRDPSRREGSATAALSL